jgi:hypothetical protein
MPEGSIGMPRSLEGSEFLLNITNIDNTSILNNIEVRETEFATLQYNTKARYKT